MLRIPIIGRYLYSVPNPNGPTGPGISSNRFTWFNLLSVQKERSSLTDCVGSVEFIATILWVDLSVLMFEFNNYKL